MSTILDLEMFIKVAETGNMSAAGRELGLSPAVVSKHISALEDKLNIRLFERTTRHLHLTEQGERYYKHVIKALRELQRAEKSLQMQTGEPQGTLKLTAPTLFGRLHLAPLICEFLSANKKIELDVNLSDEVVELTTEGYDVGIRIAHINDASLITHTLASNDRILCAAPDYLKNSGIPRSLEDIKHHNCLILKSQNNWTLDGPKGRATIQVRGKVRSNSSEFIHEAALAGEGIALRSMWEIRRDLEQGRLRVVLPGYVGLSDIKIYLVYPRRDIIPAKVEAFVNFMREKFQYFDRETKILDLTYG